MMARAVRGIWEHKEETEQQASGETELYALDVTIILTTLQSQLTLATSCICEAIKF